MPSSYAGRTSSSMTRSTLRRGPTKRQAQVREHRVVKALRRRDEDGSIYDMTRAFIEELLLHPFGAYKDLIDATSRVYDLDPHAPVAFEGRASTEPAGLDAGEIIQDALDAVTDYGETGGIWSPPTTG
jgi:hypothetical protein